MKTRKYHYFFSFVFFLIAGLILSSTAVFAASGPGSAGPVFVDDGTVSTVQNPGTPNTGSSSAPAKTNYAPTPARKPVQQPISLTPSRQPDKVQAAPASEPSPVSSQPVKLGEGVLSNYSLTYRDKVFNFKTNPVACLNGELYVSATDPDFASMFQTMGVTYSWFGFSEKLFVYLPQGSITWYVSQNYAMVGDKRVPVPLATRDRFNRDYIPLRSLTQLMDMQMTVNATTTELRPAVHFAAETDQNGENLNLVVLAGSELQSDVAYSQKPASIRLTLPKTGYNGEAKRLFLKGTQIRVNDTVDPDKLFITVEFPPHWKGNVVPSGFSNKIVIRMEPTVFTGFGMKDETIDDFDVSSYEGQLLTTFRTSGSVWYYWSYDPDEGTLYVDIPQASPRLGLNPRKLVSGAVKDARMYTYKPMGTTMTRIEMDLEPGTVFMIGSPEKSDGKSFALWAGNRETIESPSPFQGSGSMMAAGGRIIVIDPGHGGGDSGACYGGLQEKTVNLDISLRLANILAQKGWKVVLTRTTDRDVTWAGSPDKMELQARSDVANNCRASLFVSIHCNASGSRSTRGSSYYWYKQEDRMVAEYMRGSLGDNIGTSDQGIVRDSFYVLRHTSAPAVLVETAFMSNPSDNAILASADRRQKIAEQLARSIEAYLSSPNLATQPASPGGE